MAKNLQILQLPKLITERRSSAIFGAVIIAMLWAGATLKYFENLKGNIKDHERPNPKFPNVFEENVPRPNREHDTAPF